MDVLYEFHVGVWNMFSIISTLGSGVRLVYFNVLYQGGRHRIPGQLQTTYREHETLYATLGKNAFRCVVLIPRLGLKYVLHKLYERVWYTYSVWNTFYLMIHLIWIILLGLEYVFYKLYLRVWSMYCLICVLYEFHVRISNTSCIKRPYSRHRGTRASLEDYNVNTLRKIIVSKNTKNEKIMVFLLHFNS